GDTEAVRRREDLGRLPGAAERARHDGVDLVRSEPDGERLDFAPPSGGERRVEAAPLERGGGVPFALSVPYESNPHRARSLLPRIIPLRCERAPKTSRGSSR